MKSNRATIAWREFPGLEPENSNQINQPWLKWFSGDGNSNGGRSNFGCISLAKTREERDFSPTNAQLLKNPLAMVALVPREAALFVAGAVSGAAAKTVIAPLDRVKILMQIHGLRAVQEGVNKGMGFIEAFTLIGKEEGLKGYWKGNLPQVIRVVPYSATQLFAYETYKKLFGGKDGELSVISRLAAGACAGMSSTFVTYPLDVLRLRLAVEPGHKTMTGVALNMLKEEGFASFYNGLGPSLIGIAPYIAVNFCVFDLVKKALPEKYQKRTEATLVTGLVSATVATLLCYPLDTVRRQMQMKGSPYMTVLDAVPGNLVVWDRKYLVYAAFDMQVPSSEGIVARDGLVGLYRGFLPNALKTLPNSSIKLTTYDTVKRLIASAEIKFQSIVDENRKKQYQSSSDITS